MTEQLSLFDKPLPAEEPQKVEASDDVSKAPKRKLRFLALDDPARPRNRPESVLAWVFESTLGM